MTIKLPNNILNNRNDHEPFTQTYRVLSDELKHQFQQRLNDSCERQGLCNLPPSEQSNAFGDRPYTFSILEADLRSKLVTRFDTKIVDDDLPVDLETCRLNSDGSSDSDFVHLQDERVIDNHRSAEMLENDGRWSVAEQGMLASGYQSHSSTPLMVDSKRTTMDGLVGKLNALLEQHVRQMLVSEKTRSGKVTQVLLRLSQGTLDASDLMLSRGHLDTWTLHVVSARPEVVDLIEQSAPKLISRFSDLKFGALNVVV